MRIGIDLVEIARIASARDRWGDRFLERVYTSREVQVCRGRLSALAGRFAAKEAAAKALGVGIGPVRWLDLEILNAGSGAPRLELHGRARELAMSLGITGSAVSLSDTRDYAVAVVMLW